MRKLPALVLAFVVFLPGCKDDSPTPSYEFKDQAAQGKIGNVAWEYEDGKVEDVEVAFNIELLLTQPAPACENPGFGIGNQVYFTLPRSAGLFELSPNGHTVTIFNISSAQTFVATQGAVEIISASGSFLFGRIDARFDDGNFVNGSFSVPFCP